MKQKLLGTKARQVQELWCLFGIAVPSATLRRMVYHSCSRDSEWCSFFSMSLFAHKNGQVHFEMQMNHEEKGTTMSAVQCNSKTVQNSGER